MSFAQLLAAAPFFNFRFARLFFSRCRSRLIVAVGLSCAASLSLAADWPLHDGDHYAQRYSSLSDIHIDNVGRLGLAWALDTGSEEGLLGTPIVVAGRLYLSLPSGGVLALVADTGEELWRFAPKLNPAYEFLARSERVNHGVAVSDNVVYVAAIDGTLYALNADTGEPLWQVASFPSNWPYHSTSAPRVVKDLVVLGAAGSRYGVRGYVAAFDSATGQLRWRFYTVPNASVSADTDPALQKAAPSWSQPDWTAGGGGSVSQAISFDAELNLLYIGTAHGSPLNASYRDAGSGDNLYLSSILALEAESGRYVWHYQTTPADKWGFSAEQQIMLADKRIGNSARKVLMQASNNGFFYVLDRKSGELISAEPYTEVNWASAIDMDSGRPVVTAAADYVAAPAFIQPQPPGAHSWQAMATDARTGVVYIPAVQYAAWLAQDEEFRHGSGHNTGVRRRLKSYSPLQQAARRDVQKRGELLAWDPVLQKARWKRRFEQPWAAGILATAGNLLFMGHAEGYLDAYRADTGVLVWRGAVGVPVIAPPISYGVAGEQYIAVLAGWGGEASRHSRPRAFKPLSNGRIVVFKVGGNAALPVAAQVEEIPIARPPSTRVAPEDAARGERLYHAYCARCHGADIVSRDATLDLRTLQSEVFERFAGTVRSGHGKNVIDASLQPEELAFIREYVVDRAQTEHGLVQNAGWWQDLQRWFYRKYFSVRP